MHKILLISYLFFLLPFIVNSKNRIDYFFESTDVFLQHNVKDGLVDYAAIKNNPDELKALISKIASTSLAGLSKNEQVAFYINAYNIAVINAVLSDYPLTSVQTIKGFFDEQQYVIAREKMTLNELEQDKLLRFYHDPRYHFVLVCAAKGCPKITNFAYRPEKLEEQLESQTQLALNDPNFIRIDEEKKIVELSQIFSWYKEDFSVDGSLINFVNNYRKSFIPKNYRVNFYDYDWALNDVKNVANSTESTLAPIPKTSSNLRTYTPSALLKKGQFEVKLFNNLYTQTKYFDTDRIRQNAGGRFGFFSSIGQFSYGISPRLNIGFDAFFKISSLTPSSSSPFSTFAFNKYNDSHRVGMATLGPKIKFAPFDVKGLAFQTTVLFPLSKNLEGNGSDQLYLEYQGIQWFQQFLYDKSLGNNFNIFGEFSLWTKIDTKNDSIKNSSFSTPMKIFPSYFATDWLSFYLMSEWTPTWGDGGISAFYLQSGAGAKFQITKRFEMELLYSSFWFGKNGGAGQTYNIGMRYLY